MWYTICFGLCESCDDPSYHTTHVPTSALYNQTGPSATPGRLGKAGVDMALCLDDLYFDDILVDLYPWYCHWSVWDWANPFDPMRRRAVVPLPACDPAKQVGLGD